MFKNNAYNQKQYKRQLLVYAMLPNSRSVVNLLSRLLSSSASARHTMLATSNTLTTNNILKYL